MQKTISSAPVHSDAAPAPGLTRRSVMGTLAATTLASLALRVESQSLPGLSSAARRHPGRTACGATAYRVAAPPRLFHASAPLGDGSILVTGGVSYGQTPSAGAFLYLPQTGEWMAVAPMNHARAQHASAMLGDGRVVVLGGRFVSETPISSVEIYNPARDEWTQGKAMPVPRFGHSVVTVSNGRVMVLGGSHRNPLSVVHTYDVFQDDWESADMMNVAGAA